MLVLDRYSLDILENLLSSIDEIGYFMFSNNSDIVPSSKAHPNSIFVFDDVACDKQDTVREYFSKGRYSHVDLSLPVIRGISILYETTQIC